jgi:hypothetical protein
VTSVVGSVRTVITGQNMEAVNFVVNVAVQNLS